MSVSADEFQLIALHEEFQSEEILTSIINEVIEILSSEWPRADALRRRTISRSCKSLPVSFGLVSKQEPYTAVGYAQLSAVIGLEDSCFLESVIIRKDLRGKGFGRVLVHLVEDYAMKYLCPSRQRIILTAKPDQAKFYSRLGYTGCEPIAFASGNAAKLIPAAFLEKLASVNNSKSQIKRTDDVIWLNKRTRSQHEI